jgi:AcrR family transcriptional regulator
VRLEPEGPRKWRLPRGRHGLPRELVTRSQRERLLAAAVRATAAKGYAATTVADILEEAGVGRETFYELFDDKRACALEAHEILSDELEEKVRDSYTGPGEWPARAGRALATTLQWFAADPVAAKFMMVEVAAMGTAYRVRFQAEFSRFVSLVEDGLDGCCPEVSQAASLAVSAIFARLHEEIIRGRTAELPNLLPDLTYEMLVPFLGEGPAWAERTRVVATGPAGPSADR